MTSLEDLLAIEREAVNPSEEERERTAHRVATAVGFGAATASLSAATSSNAAASASAAAVPSKLAGLFSAKAVMGWSAALIVVGVAAVFVSPGLGSFVSSTATEDPVDEVPTHSTAPDVLPQKVRAKEAPAPRVPRELDAPKPSSGREKSRARVQNNGVSAPSSSLRTTPEKQQETAEAPNSLQEDAQLLSRVSLALNQGKYQEALSLMKGKSTHRSALASEFSAARAVALCSLGRREEGRAQVAALQKRAPESPVLLRVKRACSK